jgi:GntR family transcriptional regulator, rspAB operon transcriptional repressor
MTIQRSTPLYQQVYELLRQKILDGGYAPGESLQESRMAETLRVSRTPVREALRQLEQEGLLVAHGSERAVRNLTREEFVELYTCRAALERLVAERAARSATEEEMEDMAAAVKGARSAVAAGDHAGVLSANTRFHDRMVQSTRMAQLRLLMETIRGPILVARRSVLSDREVEAAICDEHEAVLDAIRRRDVRAAQDLIERHMMNDIERGVAHFDAP